MIISVFKETQLTHFLPLSIFLQVNDFEIPFNKILTDKIFSDSSRLITFFYVNFTCLKGRSAISKTVFLINVFQQFLMVLRSSYAMVSPLIRIFYLLFKVLKLKYYEQGQSSPFLFPPSPQKKI